MMWDRKSTGIFILALLSSMLLMGATPALNPRVTRTAKPAAVPVPDECHESLKPAPAPRVDVQEIPRAQYVALDLEAPRTTDLRTTLRDAQDALRRNDRGDFDATLTRTRTLLATYPPGAERRGAEELLRIYEDAALVWDAQFESPFFDASAPIYARLSTYPGWADAVRRNTLTDDRERRFFPAAESRVFLATVASDRLSRLGIRATAPATPRTSVPWTATEERRAPRVTPSKPETTPSSTRQATTTARSTSTTSRKTTTRPSSTTAAKSSSSPARSKASAEKSSRSETPKRTPDVARPSTKSANPPAPSRQTVASPSASASKPTSSPTASAATSTPPAAVSAPSPSASAAAPAVADAATSPSTPASPAGTTNTTSGSLGDVNATDTAITSDPLSSDTVATSSGEGADTIAPTTSSADPIPATPTRTRSILLPTILILIGLGVLIVLFRASN